MVKTFIGLELTEGAVRAVEVTTGRAPQVLRHAAVALPAGAARNSEVLDTDAVLRSLRMLWLRGGFRSRRVVLGAGSGDAGAVATLVQTVARARLRAVRVESRSVGLARVLGRVSPPGEASALVHLGDRASCVVVADRRMPTFAQLITADVTSARRLDERTAELVGAGHGARAPLPTAPDAEDAVRDLARRVRDALAAAAAQPGAAPIESLRLTGARAADAEVCAAIAATVGMSAILTRIDDVLPGAGALDARTAFELVGTAGIVLGEAR